MYRADIDGLRAISVLAVLFFHAGLPFLPGGFVGVDVFFVISGFLITKLLAEEFERTKDVNFLDFWARRVRRLAPALLLVLVVVLLSSILFLSRISGETGDLAKAAVAGLLINANHFFLTGSGDYFGAAAETNPLLHLWSLSVEEQFYLAWPLVLFMCLKHFGVKSTQRLLLPVFVVSLGLSCYWTWFDAARAFYLMPSRAWELVAGAWVAFFVMQRHTPVSAAWGELMGAGGLVMVVLSMVFLTGSTAFPGPAALFPVVGAGLLLLAGSVAFGSWTSKALSSAPMVYVGKISYPLYLWHWPVLVIMRSNRLYETSMWLDASALVVAVVLAGLTYEFIEKGMGKRLQNVRAKRVVLSGLTASGLVVCLALGIGGWARFGWGYTAEESRLDASRKDMPELDCMFGDGFPAKQQIDRCVPIIPGAPSILLWGDSHANHWRPAIRGAAQPLGLTPATLTMNGCRPLPGQVGTDTCIDFNKQVMENLPRWRHERGLIGLVMSARWPEGTGTQATSIQDRSKWKPGQFFDSRARTQAEALNFLEHELREVLAMAKTNELKVLLLMPGPVQHYAAAHCLSVLASDKCMVTEQEIKPYMAPAEEVVRRVAAEFSSVHLIDPRKFMCANGKCPVVIDGTIVYTDDDHVSKSFSEKQSKEFSSGLAWLMDKSN